MTPQSTFMICATIREDQLKPLRDLLATMNLPAAKAHADPNNNLVPFGIFEGLHFARFTIIEATTADEIKAYGVNPRPWPPTLAFLGDCDGDRDSFLAELATKAENGLTQIFSHCIGYPDANSEGLLAWMKTHDIQPRATYINWIGRTVRQVHEEDALHRFLANKLQQLISQQDRNDHRALRQQLLAHVEMEKHAGRLTLTPPKCTPCRWQIRNFLHLIGVPLVLLLLSPLLLLIAPFFLLYLRFRESQDPELLIRPDPEHIKNLAAQEDWDVTNQFNVFGDIKPGLFYRLTFKFLMLLTDWVARHIYKRGFLTRIRTIHSARWVSMDNDRRAFFASNYDGSHEAYMDDFINKVGWGLNITFGSAVGYPVTRWLIKDGAEIEQAFKYKQRRSQLPSEVWYKAYPGLTAVDLARNSRIRRGVEVRQKNEAEIREWLSLI